MVEIKKIANKYMHNFYIGGTWGDFEPILRILTEEMQCTIIPYEIGNNKRLIIDDVDSTRHSQLIKNDLEFELMLDEDPNLGICLCATFLKKRSDVYFYELEKIANELAEIVNKKLIQRKKV